LTIHGAEPSQTPVDGAGCDPVTPLALRQVTSRWLVLLVAAFAAGVLVRNSGSGGHAVVPLTRPLGASPP